MEKTVDYNALQELLSIPVEKHDLDVLEERIEFIDKKIKERAKEGKPDSFLKQEKQVLHRAIRLMRAKRRAWISTT